MKSGIYNLSMAEELCQIVEHELAAARRELADYQFKAGQLIGNAESESGLFISQVNWDEGCLAIIRTLHSQLAAERAKRAEKTFWVIECFTDGTSVGYWNGGHSRSFQLNIHEAVQFCRKQDAFWASKGWHWNDTKITEHIMISGSR